MLGSSITKFLKLDSLIENLTGYFETKVELIRIEVKQDIADGLSKAVVQLAIVFAFALALIFVSIGVALVIADSLGAFAGFGIVAAFYAAVGGVLIMVKDKLREKALESLSKNLNKKK